jgi:hypothetical protein
MRVPYVRGAAQRLRSAAHDAPAVLGGFSGRGLQRRIARGDFRQRQILAWRPFGLGSRFGELINAMRVAKALGAHFVFHWPPEPLFDVDAVETVFAPDFIAEHHLPTLDIEEFGRLATTIRPSDLQDFAGGQRRGARMAERYEVRFSGRGPTLPSFRETFDGIRFDRRLEDVRAAVGELPPIGLAIHLRRWDLTRPESRFGGVFSPKQLPLVLIERMVADLRRDGAQNILLIGNDPDLVDEVSSRIGARAPHDMVPLATGSLQEEAFRDLCLLARSERVLGGSSAFARVAQLIAGATVVRPEAMLSAHDTRELLWSTVMNDEQGRPLEATLASDHLFQRPDLILSAADEVALLERTIELDPEDPTRWFGLLARGVRSGDERTVGRVMAEMSERFRGREQLTVQRAARGRTSRDHPAHLTDADWQDLLRFDGLEPAWVQALRAAG